MVRYYSDEKNGVVVCLLTDTQWDATDYIQKKMGGFTFAGLDYTTYKMADSYRGIARCNFDAGDTFDLEKGKEIARKRAIEKCFAAKDKMVAKYKANMEELLARL